MKVAIPPEWKEVRNLMDLIYLVELNSLICKIIYDKAILVHPQHKLHDFLLLSANNSFHTAVETLHTLVVSKRKDELTLAAIIKNKFKNDKTKLQQLEKIKNDFCSLNFDKVRHQTIAHKNKAIPVPAGQVHGLIGDLWIKNLLSISEELKKTVCPWFNYSQGNPFYYVVNTLEKFIGSPIQVSNR